MLPAEGSGPFPAQSAQVMAAFWCVGWDGGLQGWSQGVSKVMILRLSGQCSG